MLHFIFQNEGIEKESKAEATKEGRRKTELLFQASLVPLLQSKCGEGLLKTLHFPEGTTCPSERKHVGEIKGLGEFAAF